MASEKTKMTCKKHFGIDKAHLTLQLRLRDRGRTAKFTQLKSNVHYSACPRARSQNFVKPVDPKPVTPNHKPWTPTWTPEPETPSLTPK